MTAPTSLTKDQLRAKHGDDCWLCGGRLSFSAPANSKKAPTIEHLDARSNGGSNAPDNLVLCHPGCNRQLGSRPKAEKVKMRDKRVRHRAEQVAKNATAPFAAPAPTPVRTTDTPKRTAQFVSASSADQLWTWQQRAALATGAALFFAGLSLGQFVAG